jgi:ribosomal protein S7
MVKRYRDLTEKYRSFRLQPDGQYQSRFIQTIFNKFTKKGKKAVARRHLARALKHLRFSVRRPRTFNLIIRMIESLNVPFLLVPTRKSKTILDVPTPIRRNKRDIISIQTFYNAVKKRRERGLFERIEQELLYLTVRQEQSTTLRQRNNLLSRVYEERANLDYRWK